MSIHKSSTLIYDNPLDLAGLNALFKKSYSIAEVYNYLDSFSVFVNPSKARLVFYIVPAIQMNKVAFTYEPYLFLASVEHTPYSFSPYIKIRRLTAIKTMTSGLKDREYTFSEIELIKYFKNTKWRIYRWTQEEI